MIHLGSSVGGIEMKEPVNLWTHFITFLKQFDNFSSVIYDIKKLMQVSITTVDLNTQV